MSKHIFWIASYPKSGNTLMRAILSSLFFTNDGNFTFEKFKNVTQFETTKRLNIIKDLNEKDFLNLSKISIISKYWLKLQEKKIMNFKEDFIFLKTHNAAVAVANNPFTKESNIRGLIYLIRDPRDVAISWSKHTNLEINETIKFMKNEYACIAWKNPGKTILPNNIEPRVVVSSWDKNIISWTKNTWSIPKLIIRFEDLVYDKENTILKLINFFKLNYNFKFNNIDQKLENILKTTDFKNLKKEESSKGFNEASNGPFFRKGLKNQWKIELNDHQIKNLEDKFSKTMLENDYSLNFN